MLFNTLQMSVRCLRCANVLPSTNIKSLIKVQSYASWVHRQPVAVVNEEIILNQEEIAPRPRKYVDENNQEPPLKLKTRKRASKPRHPTPAIRSNQTYKPDGSLNYATVIDDNRELAALMLNLKSKKKREKSHQLLLEGRRLIIDAIKAGLKLDIVLFSRPTDVMKMPLPPQDVQLIKIPYKMLQLWSSLTTTPGLMGIFEFPETLEKETTKDSIPLTIICDNVREPGNLGTILRAAAGAGCERVILTKGCVDLWDAKVLRSAAGAHFRVSISNSVEWADVESLISPSADIFAADNNVTVSSMIERVEPVVTSQEDWASDDEEDVEFITSTEASESADKMTKSVECKVTETNVETGQESILSPDASESTDETTEQSVRCNENETTVVDQETIRKVPLEEATSCIPVIPYYAVDYTKNEVVLIVGGETHGLSCECIQLLRDNDGVRVNVPMSNEVDSLNTGMALGIVAFEIRKQFLIRKRDIEQ